MSALSFAYTTPCASAHEKRAAERCDSLLSEMKEQHSMESILRIVHHRKGLINAQSNFCQTSRMIEPNALRCTITRHIHHDSDLFLRLLFITITKKKKKKRILFI
jgi:hypothetical protein